MGKLLKVIFTFFHVPVSSVLPLMVILKLGKVFDRMTNKLDDSSKCILLELWRSRNKH